MIKIDFKTNVTFWTVTNFCIKNKIKLSICLEQAYEQKVLKDDDNDLLLNFIKFLKINNNNSTSQLMQDLFAIFIIQKNFHKTFLEFGATDGISLSNSYILEKELGWKGVLVEPDSQWMEELKKNRSKSNILNKCIWKKTGEKMNFFSSENRVFSTLDEFKFSDKKSMPLNSESRNKKGKIVKIETISLNDVIKDEFKNLCPSYISVDTEGSEYEILKAFNFKKYRPVVFTVEHNFTELQNKIDKLMTQNGYLRVFRHLTAFDAWYISSKAMSKLI